MTAEKLLFIMKAGSAPAPLVAQMGDFEDWIQQAAGDDFRLAVVDVQRPGRLPDAANVAGVILTGSQAMVTDRELWSLELEKWTADVVRQGVPTLGICYGHQLLAQALGGEVADRRQGVEIGTVEVIRTAEGESDVLFGALPAKFVAQTIHWQSVVRLPPQAVLLARTNADALHAFRYGANAWGVQFHPEFSATHMAGYLEILERRLTKQGTDAAALAAVVKPTPEARSILPVFVQCAMASG